MPSCSPQTLPPGKCLLLSHHPRTTPKANAGVFFFYCSTAARQVPPTPPVIALAYLPRASLLCSVAAAHNGGHATAHGRAVCLTAATPTTRASASPLLTPSPWAPRSRACPCDCAGALATRITPLQCGCRAQRLAPALITVALCASQPRPPRREPVHPYCSRRLHGHHAHVRAPVIAPATLLRASLLCSVTAAHNGWRHHGSRLRYVPHSRDTYGESQCIPTAHAVSTGTMLTRVPL